MLSVLPRQITLLTALWATANALAQNVPETPPAPLWERIVECSGAELETAERLTAKVTRLRVAAPKEVVLVEAGAVSLIVSLAPDAAESPPESPADGWNDTRSAGSGYCAAYEGTLPTRGRGRARPYLAGLGPVHVMRLWPIHGALEDGFPALIAFFDTTGRPVAAIADGPVMDLNAARTVVSKTQPSLELTGSSSCGCGPTERYDRIYHDFGQGPVAILGVDRGPGGKECDEEREGCIDTWKAPGSLRILGLGQVQTIQPIDYDCEAMPDTGESWKTTWTFDAAEKRFRRTTAIKIPFVAHRPCR